MSTTTSTTSNTKQETLLVRTIKTSCWTMLWWLTWSCWWFQGPTIPKGQMKAARPHVLSYPDTMIMDASWSDHSATEMSRQAIIAPVSQTRPILMPSLLDWASIYHHRCTAQEKGFLKSRQALSTPACRADAHGRQAWYWTFEAFEGRSS